MRAFAKTLSILVLTGVASAAPDEPLSPDEAARSARVPDGFRVTCFAAEPDVLQPVSLAIDDRGRLWVAEAHAYPKHSSKPGKDRIVVFEDTDGDGRHDRRSVFYDQLNYVSGIEIGFGGVWVMSPPYFFFIPDRDGDDRPDTEPRVVLDGFGNHANAHNMANGFAWGPDGWLYGTHGRTNWSMIGRPGADSSDRVRFDGGVWRYHPVRDVWEPYADGTTNPWGIDWNDWGEAFISNCVNPHLFHVIPGAHYEPWRGRKSSEHAYERIPTIADHLHYTGGNNVRAALGSEAESAAGGGHAHSGTMVYLGGTWPEKYRNTVLMNNIHGRRINNDVLVRRGSGYSASHGRDLMLSKDPWFMGVSLRYGPDGNVFVIDWSDTGECHSTRNTRRHTGRIYKISHGDDSTSASSLDLSRLGDARLVELQTHRNDWFVRHARRILSERHHAGRDLSSAREGLLELYREAKDVPLRLRALWALHVIDGIDDGFLIEQLHEESEYIRAWAVRLLCEERDAPAEASKRLEELARKDPSPYLRLHLASTLQRLELAERWKIAEALASHGEDTKDKSLPLMIWYGIEPLVDSDLDRFVGLAASAQIPLLVSHIARRAVSVESARLSRSLEAVCLALARVDEWRQLALIQGMERGLRGRRRLAMPKAWPAARARLEKSSEPGVVESVRRLALVFEDPRALADLTSRVLDTAVNPEERRRALDALIASAAPDLAATLHVLVPDPAVGRYAIRGLAEFDDPKTPDILLGAYRTLGAAARQDAIQALASRSLWAHRLLDAVESRSILRAEISAYTARQIRGLRDRRLAQRLGVLWGELRDSPEEKAREIERLRRQLKPKQLASADASRGRALFDKVCASCHRLFGEGEAIGPDITGAQRSSLDYLLENIVDPSASVSKDFQMSTVTSRKGRVITGLIVEQSDASLTIQTVNEQVVVPLSEILMRTRSGRSLMPDGLLSTLSDGEIRDLVRYLQSPSQVSRP